MSNNLTDGSTKTNTQQQTDDMRSIAAPSAGEPAEENNIAPPEEYVAFVKNVATSTSNIVYNSYQQPGAILDVAGVMVMHALSAMPEEARLAAIDVFNHAIDDFIENQRNNTGEENAEA